MPLKVPLSLGSSHFAVLEEHVIRIEENPKDLGLETLTFVLI